MIANSLGHKNHLYIHGNVPGGGGHIRIKEPFIWRRGKADLYEKFTKLGATDISMDFKLDLPS